MTEAALEFLSGQLADSETHWSLGTFGALAEFMRDADEPVAFAHSEQALAAVTDRGGIRIEPLPDMRLIASESPTRESWSQRIALCLPEERSAMSRRGVFTELGPDAQALRAQDRDAILFDLGLAALQVDVCVRVDDPGIVAQLRSCCGRALFAPNNPAMAVILAASPHRVFMGRLGRIEVFQPIPPADGKSPQGPHTHVLPNLLAHKRTHAATEPIPDNWVPCAHLYPAHPAKDALGRRRSFDGRRHESFQRMLCRFGDADAVALKQRVIAAMEEGKGPSVVAVPDDRFARANIRVALRQIQAASRGLPALSAWVAAHERPHHSEAQGEDAGGNEE